MASPTKKSSLWSRTSKRGKLGIVFMGYAVVWFAMSFDETAPVRGTDAVVSAVVLIALGFGLLMHGKRVWSQRQGEQSPAKATVVSLGDADVQPSADPGSPAAYAPLRRLEGLGKTLDVFAHELTITPTGFLGVIDSIKSGGITIPLSSITAIQFKDGGAMRHGYMQFGMIGGGPIVGNIDQAVDDPNTITFPSDKNAEAREVKTFIEKAMREARAQPSPAAASVSDELGRLADLRSKGVLTDEEFSKAKAKLLAVH